MATLQMSNEPPNYWWVRHQIYKH